MDVPGMITHGPKMLEGELADIEGFDEKLGLSRS